MKRSINYTSVSEIVILIIIIGAFFIQGIGTTKFKQENNDGTSISKDSSYILDCEQILKYENGTNTFGKKRMILSTAAKYYHDEECKKIDRTLPIVNVEFIEDYKGYELYWIIQGDPSDFHFNNHITDIECMGDYVTLYYIKDQPAISYESIQQKGFNDQSEYFIVQELSWFLLIDPKVSRILLVKNAITQQDCESLLYSFNQDKSSAVRVVHCKH